MKRYVLKLYINGQTPRSRQAIANLHAICEGALGREGYKLTIIDVLERPHLAEEDKILATPVLIREVPLPQRRIIGDLSNQTRVLAGLDLYDRALQESEGGGS